LRHAGNSVVDRAGKAALKGYATERVTTRTLDSIAVEEFCDESRPVVIKLDVEGAEIGALRGARKLFQDRDCTLIFEEHGKDPDCKVSKFVMDELGMAIFMMENGALIRVTLESVKRLKKSPSTGYNLMARRIGDRPFQDVAECT
jgi:hypothetical protein